MVAPMNVRLPQRVSDALNAHAKKTAKPKSAVVSMAVDEWLRLQDHPSIRFVTPITGQRRAALVDGPEVWSVAEAWLQCTGPDRTVASVAEVTGLRIDQVEAALAYWADNREEVDQTIEAIHQAQHAEYAAWQRRQALDHLP